MQNVSIPIAQFSYINLKIWKWVNDRAVQSTGTPEFPGRLLKPLTDEQVLYDKVFYDKFILCLVYEWMHVAQQLFYDKFVFDKHLFDCTSHNFTNKQYTAGQCSIGLNLLSLTIVFVSCTDGGKFLLCQFFYDKRT